MRRIHILIVVVLLVSTIAPLSASANGSFNNDSKLFPSEEELGYKVRQELNYKKYPLDYYNWDTVHKWFTMKLLVPKIGNVGELTLHALTTPWVSFNNSMSRLSIFFLQLGFNNNIFEQAINSLDSKLKPVKTFLFNNLFGIISLIFAGILIFKYAQGRKGEGYMVIIKAILYSAIIFGMIDQGAWVIKMVGGFFDHVALLVLGLMHLSPVLGQDAVALANDQILTASNGIFNTYVYKPWVFGQFGTMTDVPLITGPEYSKLVGEGITNVAVGQPWTEVMLQYPPNSDARDEMVKIISDTSVAHDPNLDPSMVNYGGGMRLLVAFLSTLLNISGMILYGATGMIQLLSKIGLIITVAILPFVVIFSFFGEFGERALKNVMSFFFLFGSLKLAAAFFIGVPMLLIYVLNLDSWHYLLSAIVMLLINIVGIMLLPQIFKTIAPAIVRGTMKAAQLVSKGKVRMDRDSLKNVNQFGKRVSTFMPKIRAEANNGNFEKRDMPPVAERHDYITRTIPVHDWESKRDIKVAYRLNRERSDSRLPAEGIKVRSYTMKKLPYSEIEILEDPKSPDVELTQSKIAPGYFGPEEYIAKFDKQFEDVKTAIAEKHKEQIERMNAHHILHRLDHKKAERMVQELNDQMEETTLKESTRSGDIPITPPKLVKE